MDSTDLSCLYLKDCLAFKRVQLQSKNIAGANRNVVPAVQRCVDVLDVDPLRSLSQFQNPVKTWEISQFFGK